MSTELSSSAVIHFLYTSRQEVLLTSGSEEYVYILVSVVLDHKGHDKEKRQYCQHCFHAFGKILRREVPFTTDPFVALDIVVRVA